jgi:hypothetical protein
VGFCQHPNRARDEVSNDKMVWEKPYFNSLFGFAALLITRLKNKKQ